MKVVWSSEALGKLDEIERFIAQDNPERALAFIELLQETANRLRLFLKWAEWFPGFHGLTFGRYLSEITG